MSIRRIELELGSELGKKENLDSSTATIPPRTRLEVNERPSGEEVGRLTPRCRTCRQRQNSARVLLPT